MTLFEIKIELEALITEREGMIVENQISKSLDGSYLYGVEHFQKIVDKIRDLAILAKDCN